MQSRAESPGTDRDAALLTRTRDLLGDIAGWRLPAVAWSRPSAAVEALAAAYEAGDGLALAIAVARLEVLSPHRVERIAEPSDVPPPEPLVEQATALVHLIGEQNPGAAGKDDGDDDRR